MRGRAVLGTIAQTVGLKGEVRFLPAPDFWPNCLDAGPVELINRGESVGKVRADSWREQGDGLVVRFEGVDSIEEAKKLVGSSIVLDLSELALRSQPDRILPCQLMGLKVYLLDGSLLGVVVDLLMGPMQNCLVVEQDSVRYLVPYVPAIVKRTSLDEERIEIDPPEGLMDLRW